MQLSPTIYSILLICACALLSACGDPIGSTCAITGSGFHAKQNCQHRCLQYRQITCPNQQTINPHICSGAANCAPGSCPGGQTCYTIEDPFNNESYCVPDDVCGTLDASELSQWEQQSLHTAQSLRDAYKKKQEQRRNITAPSVDTP